MVRMITGLAQCVQLEMTTLDHLDHNSMASMLHCMGDAYIELGAAIAIKLPFIVLPVSLAPSFSLTSLSLFLSLSLDWRCVHFVC